MIQLKQQCVTPLDKAVAAVGGSQKDLAGMVGLTPQAISLIKKRGGNLPVRRMTMFVDATGLPREELYPEIFGTA